MGTLLEQLKKDVRYQEGLKACINCGTCTAICPAAAVSNYDPRQVVDDVQSDNEFYIKELLISDTIWRCGECLSCKTRCPRGNTPGYIIQALRALSIESGLFKESEEGRKQTLLAHSIGTHMLDYGYCVYFDALNTEDFPEQGPVWDWVMKNRKTVLEKLGCSYKQDKPGSLRKVPEHSMRDLRAIFKETGAIDRLNKLKDI